MTSGWRKRGRVVLRRLAAKLPPRFIRAVGRLQFRYPIVRSVTRRLNAALTEGEGIIRHGPGAGLRFDAAGGQPGYLLGTSEPEEQKFLWSLLKPGSVFYDIGANIGFFSTLAGRMVHPGGSVWAFEPFPASAAQARRNAMLNGFDHVHVVQAAVGRDTGTLRMVLGEGSQQHRVGQCSNGPAVHVVTVDRWRQQTDAPPPDVVMIDVEGSEIDVLSGMMDVLSEHRPVVACEVHWLGQAFVEFVERRIEPLGYQLSALSGGIPSGPDRWHALLTPA